MTLLIDIGNSTIVVAAANHYGDICHHWRFKTQKDATAAFFLSEIEHGIKDYAINVAEIDNVIVSSVVPEINDDIALAIKEITGKHAHFFSVEDATKLMDIEDDIEAPGMIGKDRIADALGAMTCYGVPAIVFDMGTATTVGFVDGNRCFKGGMIIPGVKTALHALSQRASQLPVIDVECPKNAIGKNTVECMQSGILYGNAAMVDGLIDRFASILGDDVKVIATGGMAKQIIPHCKHDIIIEPFLQFKGLFSIMHHQEGK